jgi:solute:Na+ symporter, SSS family
MTHLLRRTAVLLALLPTFVLGVDRSNNFSRLEFADAPTLGETLDGLSLGTAGGVHLAAGGLTPQGTPRAEVYFRTPGDDRWTAAGDLPDTRAFAATVTDGDRLLLVGGQANGVPTTLVTALRIVDRRVETTALPPLPASLARPAATLRQGTLYALGNDATGANRFFSLALGLPDPQWEEREPWPGAALLAPQFLFSFEHFYLFGQTAEGPVGYRWEPRRGWRAISTPISWGDRSSAFSYGESHVLALVDDEAPGIAVNAYHVLTDTWVNLGTWEAEGAPRATLAGDRIVALAGDAATTITLIPPRTFFHSWIDGGMIVLYLLGMIGMGAYFVRKERNTTDYFRAGNNVPWWAIGMSLFATAASAISLMTMPGKSFSSDWTFFAISVYSALCLPLALFFIAPLIRRLRIATAFQYLEQRFGIVARMIGSTIFILSQIMARMAPIIFLPSLAMSAVTGIPVVYWILVIGLVTTLYTFLGGLSAVIWTDTIQGFIMLATVAGCLILILFRIDYSFTEAWTILRENDKLHTFDWSFSIEYGVVWVVLLGTVFNTLIGVGDQNFVQRVQAAPSLRDAKKAVATQMAVAIPINVVLFGLGTALYLYFKQHPAEINPTIRTDSIYPFFAAQQLPVGVSGLVIAALLAASMSTVSSAICSIANIGVDDFYRRFAKNVSESSALLVGRVLSITVGMLGIGGAFFIMGADDTSVWDWALRIAGLIGNGTVGLFGLGLLTRRANQIGVLIGLACGTFVTFYVQTETSITFWLYMAIGSTVTFVVGYIMSLLFAPLYKEPKSLKGLTIYSLPPPE